MELGPDWSMVIITTIYVVATIFIWLSNKKSADAAQKSVDAANAALEESKKQFSQSIKLQQESTKAAIDSLEESKRQFTQSFELQQKSTEAAIGALEESKNQFKQNIELQKQYNRDSVRPALSVDFSTDSKDGGFFGRVKITN